MASKKDKSREKKDKRADSRKRNDGHAEIAKAEQALAKALRQVEDARSKVIRRERELLELMKKHGRIPMDEDTDADDEAESVSSILDQAQVDSDVAGETEDSADFGENGAEHADIDTDGPAEVTVALFDQKQVVES
jgi:hypothetical protein